MNSVAVNPHVLVSACSSMLTRKALEFRHEQAIVIGRVMQPRGLRAVVQRRRSKAEALAKLSRKGSPLDKLNDAFLAQCRLLLSTRALAQELAERNAPVLLHARVYALVEPELRQHAGAVITLA